MSIGIIGGGASAMILAAKLKNKDVTIIEKNSKLGKKLLITGNGKCNFTSGDFTNIDNIYNNDFARNLYKKYDEMSCIEFYSSIGVVPKTEIHKNIRYYYPNSNKSTSIYYNLLDKIIENNVKILYNTCINKIERNDDKFILYDENNKKYYYDKIILATGGITHSNTGSTGSGYIFAKKFGHNIISPIPALSGLKSSDSFFKQIKNVRVDANASAWYKDDTNFKFIDSEYGEIQFTEYGLSGIPIYNLSRKVNRYIDKKFSVYIYLNFSYDKNLDVKRNTDAVYKSLIIRRDNIPYKKAIDFLCGYLPDEISRVIIEISGISKEKNVKEINNDELMLVAKNIVNFKISISSFCDENTAQITLGGVDTSEIDANTLMSKLVKNLYFVGEVMDIDGKCGGYNLQLAYSTASIVADNI